MIRIIVRQDNAEMAANVGGSVFTSLKTFDYDLPELERWLADESKFSHAQVIGVELLDNNHKRP